MGQRLGQHYLFDRSILERIAGAACGAHASTVIEIGPGPGGLTERLLLRCDRLVAVELDHALAEALRSRYAADRRFELVEADVLHIDLSHWGRAVVVGNIPYYITSPIVERALGLGPLLERAVFLVQKDVQTLFSVKRGAFRPPPKVESAVVLLEPRSEPLCADVPGFLRFASACFRQKRKTLRNNLAGVYEKERIEALEEAPLRAEQLAVSELVRLFAKLKDS